MPQGDFGLEDIYQMVILPNLPLSGGFVKLLTAVGVYSWCLCTYPAVCFTAPAKARDIMDIQCKHTSLTRTINSDIGYTFQLTSYS